MPDCELTDGLVLQTWMLVTNKISGLDREQEKDEGCQNKSNENKLKKKCEY